MRGTAGTPRALFNNYTESGKPDHANTAPWAVRVYRHRAEGAPHAAWRTTISHMTPRLHPAVCGSPALDLPQSAHWHCRSGLQSTVQTRGTAGRNPNLQWRQTALLNHGESSNRGRQERNCCVKVQTAFPQEHNDSSALLISISSWLSSHRNKSQLFLQFPLLRAEYGLHFSRRLDRTGALLEPRRGGGNALPLLPARRSSLLCVYAPGYQHPELWLMEAAGGTLQSFCINGTSDHQKCRIPTPQCQDFLLCIHQKLPLCSKTRLVQLFISQTLHFLIMGRQTASFCSLRFPRHQEQHTSPWT